jgi:hypothetical protein
MTEGVPCRIQIQENNQSLALDQRGRLVKPGERGAMLDVWKLKPTTHNGNGGVIGFGGRIWDFWAPLAAVLF